MLTEQQEKALQRIKEFTEGDDTETSLRGYAGTGKSYLMPHLVEALRPMRICFTAPTNKAVRVLEQFLWRNQVSAPCCTIHKLLGLVLKTRGGKQVLEELGDYNADHYDLIVVDESSMINQELFTYCQKAAKFGKVQFLYVGDPAQLPPVNEAHSLSMRIKGPVLTEVIRQCANSPILNFCTDLRQYQRQNNLSMPPVVHTPPTLELPKGQRFLKKDIEELFAVGRFEEDPDSARILAWTNERVRSYNNRIHRMRYPDCDDLFAKGEPVVFSNPAMLCAMVHGEHDDHESVLVQTETEGIVVDCQRGTHPIQRKAAWKVSVKLDWGETITVWTLDEPAHWEFQAELNTLAIECRTQLRPWERFWRLKLAFADLRPAYALTIHKSQGSTFETVLVDVQDVWKNPNRLEAMRCLYTACSRPSKRLIINAGNQ